mmetsp:Transcript_2739/g.6542  ORF Transcript_2739/g.6542 Transcript_2739/m.6542 type:complete len:522 (-) Transcript_2739:100-1665(-)
MLKECLGVLDSHGVGGSNDLVGTLNNDNSISGSADSFGDESSNAVADVDIGFFNGGNDGGLASLHVSERLASDLFGGGKHCDGSSGTELGNLLGSGTGFGADNNGLGTDINGGLDGRRSDRFGSREASEFVEGGVADGSVKGVVIDGSFGFDAGFSHDGNSGLGVFSVGGFSGKHDGIGSVKNGVGDIGTLGTGRARVCDHGFEHLRGGDNGFSDDVGLSDHHLLGQENLLGRDLHTKISTGDHDTIGDLQDFVIVFETFLVLDLADDLDSLVLGSKDFTNLENIGSLAHEGGSDEIDFIGDTPFGNVGNILLGQSGEVDDNTGQVHVLALTNGGVVHDLAGNFSLLDITRDDLQDQGSIGNQDGLSRRDRSGQFAVRAGKLGVVTLELVVGSEDESLSLYEFNLLALGKETGSDFGSLGVEQDTNGLSDIGGSLTKTIQAGLVSGVVTVGEVESGDVESGLDQGLQLIDLPARGSKGAENLGGAAVNGHVLEDHVNIDVASRKFRVVRLHLVGLCLLLRG